MGSQHVHRMEKMACVLSVCDTSFEDIFTVSQHPLRPDPTPFPPAPSCVHPFVLKMLFILYPPE